MNELTVKHQRVAGWLDRHKLSSVTLWDRNNFAWMTGGHDNHIARFLPYGVAGLLVTKDRVVCVTDTIEGPRFRDEELPGTGIEVIDFPWHDPEAGRRKLRDLAGPAGVVDSDARGVGLPSMPADFVELRWSLLPNEVDRYRIGGRLASEAMEAACRSIRPGMTEKEIAGVLDAHVHTRGGHPVVTLIAADDRFKRFRHPIPTMNRFERVVMLVICSEYKGLISNLTRVVHVGKVDASTRATIQSVANIDAEVNLSSVPGRTLGELFSVIQSAYAAQGHAEQWKYHHQGGTTGYAGREVFATPDSKVALLASQAVAWNPSVPGCKFEDTVWVGGTSGSAIEVLTGHTPSWPTVVGACRLGELSRAGWLEI